MDGFVTVNDPVDSVQYNQVKNDAYYGYGIQEFYFGAVYRGEFKHGYQEGYGFKKHSNDNEYDGLFKGSYRHGEAVFKNGLTGRVERRIYEMNKVKEVLEVIDEGQDHDSLEVHDPSQERY